MELWVKQIAAMQVLAVSLPWTGMLARRAMLSLIAQFWPFAWTMDGCS
jgi:hypothetical protein